jgi:BON domain-containing protein
MNKLLVGLTGVGAGAAFMYIADPHQGARRRARVREAAAHANHVVTAVAATTSRDVRHRLSGLTALVLDPFAETHEPIDGVLVERVRARLGRLVSHPGAIHVSASNGVVTLKGQIFEAEIDQVMKGVAEVSGVTAIDNHLEAHTLAIHVPALQGAGPRKMPGPAAKWFRWTPTERLIAFIAGAGLVAIAAPRKGLRSVAEAAAGMELIARSVTTTRT